MIASIKYRQNSILLLLGLLVLLGVLLLVTLACEPSITIIVSNQTDETLKIFFGDAFIDEAIPRGEVTFKTAGIFSKYKIIAKDTDGNTVYTANFTGEDIRGKKTYRVVIPATAKSVEHPSDSMITISVYNGTRETLLIFYNNVFIGKVSNNVEVSWEADGTLPQYIIVAEDLGGNMAAGIHGNIVYATTFTQDDLKGKRTYRVVIPATAKTVE